MCACFFPQGPPGGGGPPGTPIMPSPGGTVDLFSRSPFCISFTHSLSPRLYNRHSRKQFVSLQERRMLSTSQTPCLTPFPSLPTQQPISLQGYLHFLWQKNKTCDQRLPSHFVNVILLRIACVCDAEAFEIMCESVFFSHALICTQAINH